MIARAKSVSVRLDQHAKYVKKTFNDAKDLIGEIKGSEGSSDTIRHIVNISEQCEQGRISF